MLKIEGGHPRNALRQRNHIMWTTSLQDKLPKSQPFHIAPILEDGTITHAWHWFISPFIEGTPFAVLGKDGISEITIEQPEEIMPRIVDLMRFIGSATAAGVAGIDARYDSIARSNKAKMIETAIHWARNDTPYLADLLQLIEANYVHLRPTNTHGDFTETNLIINNKREPVLLDAEISNAYHYKYYDAVEFYNRLFTRACQPELAAAFLHIYIKKMPKNAQQKFLNNFLCLSALRCIGNFMEIAGFEDGPGKQKRLMYATDYARAIVTYKITTPSLQNH